MNSFTVQLKETSPVSVPAINELTRSGRMVYARTFRPFEIYLAYTVALLSRYLERVFHMNGKLSC